MRSISSYVHGSLIHSFFDNCRSLCPDSGNMRCRSVLRARLITPHGRIDEGSEAQFLQPTGKFQCLLFIGVGMGNENVRGDLRKPVLAHSASVDLPVLQELFQCLLDDFLVRLIGRSSVFCRAVEGAGGLEGSVHGAEESVDQSAFVSVFQWMRFRRTGQERFDRLRRLRRRRCRRRGTSRFRSV
jgi:hypothetical protein